VHFLELGNASKKLDALERYNIAEDRIIINNAIFCAVITLFGVLEEVQSLVFKPTCFTLTSLLGVPQKMQNAPYSSCTHLNAKSVINELLDIRITKGTVVGILT
jgi:hypothetical protein